MALDFGFLGNKTMIEGESGDILEVNDGNLNISGNVVIDNAYLDVQQSGAFAVNVEDAYIPVSQSGSWTTNIDNAYLDVQQSGSWTTNITGTTDINVTNSVIDMNISGATIENGTILSDFKYIVDNGTRVNASNWAENNTRTVYIVSGASNTFYLSSATLNLKNKSDINSNCDLFVDSTDNPIMSVRCNGDNTNATTSISPNPPITFESGAEIKISTSAANAAGIACIQGFLI